MSIIHKTTLAPTKLELLTVWLPGQAWYGGEAGRTPVLERAGGFRLDDPAGEVGIEFMVCVDTSGAEPVAYHVPMTYRAAPLDGGEAGLIGTTEHGVLGRRWVYDATRDPVFVAQLLALLQGRAEPQAQRVSDTPDPTVTVHAAGAGFPETAAGAAVDTAPGGDGTRIVLGDDGADAASGGRAVIDVRRVPGAGGAAAGGEDAGHVTAGWTEADGTERRGVFAVLHRVTD